MRTHVAVCHSPQYHVPLSLKAAYTSSLRPHTLVAQDLAYLELTLYPCMQQPELTSNTTSNYKPRTLQTKTKEFTRLGYTGLVVELGHLKIGTRLINEKCASAMGEYVTLLSLL